MSRYAHWPLIAAVAALLTAAAPAAAQSIDHLQCEFTALAQTDGIPSIQKDLGDGLLHDFERNFYDLAGPASCSGVVNGAVVAPGVNNATIASAGIFDSVACGTGWALDPTGANTMIGANVNNVAYEIPFVTGSGPMLIGTGQESTDPVHAGRIAGDWAGEGVAHLQPVSPGNCGTTDMSEFTVSGHFSITRRINASAGG